MDPYLFLKWFHVLSATIFFGTGVASAFYLFMANRRKDLAAIVFVTRHVVIADWLFTTPALFAQAATGAMMVSAGGYHWGEGWLVWALVFFAIAVGCWLPVVCIQIFMRDMAQKALANHTELPPRYWQLDYLWNILGWIALVSLLLVFYLMVFKPDLG